MPLNKGKKGFVSYFMTGPPSAFRYKLTKYKDIHTPLLGVLLCSKQPKLLTAHIQNPPRRAKDKTRYKHTRNTNETEPDASSWS